MREISIGRDNKFAMQHILIIHKLQKKDMKNQDHGGSKGSKIALIFFVLAEVALLSFFLFKLWQKRKHEEQYAHLLKLFEKDDELELELGLRD
ncbi:hypothetical protein CDL12_00168 [Handroanthus impetiginosus]|uniref:Uncharacterized protein n=1 Tax=Handroanthus impetiginosus TaxID=429701 RepID=A0A2G9IBL9_9LAMI|nr:hypothetical protein CDL12_00168 [Handroanthus impetiginosus]